jgi:hypothetical protein
MGWLNKFEMSEATPAIPPTYILMV